MTSDCHKEAMNSTDMHPATAEYMAPFVRCDLARDKCEC